MKALRKLGEVDFLFEMLIQILADGVNPLLVSDTAYGLDLQGGKHARVGFACQIHQRRQYGRQSPGRRQRWKSSNVFGDPLPGLGMTEGKTIRRIAQQASDPSHLFQFEEMLSQEIMAKLQNYRAMSFCGLRLYRDRAPTVRYVGAKQNQVARPIVSNTIAYQSLPVTISDERQLIFGMIVPVKWELTIVSLKRNEGRCTRGNLLERRLHGHSVRLNWQKTNDFDENAVNSVSIVVNQREDRVGCTRLLFAQDVH